VGTQDWTWAALSFHALVVALSLIALRLAETSTTDRQEEVAFLMIEGVRVAAGAAVALCLYVGRAEVARACSAGSGGAGC